MPLQSKSSRSAKNRWQNPHAASTRHATSPPSPEGSVYSVSDNSSDISITSKEGSDNSGQETDVDASVEALQCLYAVFLPPHLCLEAHSREKHQKIKNRRSVYTGDSRQTNRRKNAAREHAAKGCTTLDAFVMRRKRQRSPSPDEPEIEEIAPPLSHADSGQLTPDLEEIAPPVVHFKSGRSRMDLGLAPSAAALRSGESTKSVPVRVQDHTVDVQPHSIIDNAIEQLAEQLAVFCFERLERSTNPIGNVDSMNVDTDVDELADELRVRDLLQ
ncbi:hypothetical protein BC827DRAFT_1156355 [Russula dissimulans]|nr:hypothetical protein BC827DRAFT_1156355 [Russula dissimulans]